MQARPVSAVAVPALLLLALPAGAQSPGETLPTAADFEGVSTHRLSAGERLVRDCVGETSLRAERACPTLLRATALPASVEAELYAHRARHNAALQRTAQARLDRGAATELRSDVRLFAGNDRD